MTTKYGIIASESRAVITKLTATGQRDEAYTPVIQAPGGARGDGQNRQFAQLVLWRARGIACEREDVTPPEMPEDDVGYGRPETVANNDEPVVTDTDISEAINDLYREYSRAVTTPEPVKMDAAADIVRALNTA